MSAPPAAARRWIAWFAAVMIAIVAASVLLLVLAQRLRRAGDRLARLQAEARACPQRVVRSDTRIIDHADAPASQPLGKTAYIEYGTDVLPLLRLRVERVRAGGGVESVRLGAPDVLSPRAIHVLGLWAPWCGVCKQLFPRLRDLFARRTDWRDAVRFVPVQVLDPSAPDLAVARWRHLMPPSRVQLADRSARDELVDILRAEERRLYAGELPVVLVMACGRVRWAKLGAFAADDLVDFERRIDQFVAELHDETSQCARVWCGNGRCEHGEVGRCPDDCEVGSAPEPGSAVGATAPASTPGARAPASPQRACPEDCPRCDDAGRCLRLWGDAPAGPPTPAGSERCGDGDCQDDEHDCCRDCGCQAALVCRIDATGAHRCQPALWPEPDDGEHSPADRPGDRSEADSARTARPGDM